MWTTPERPKYRNVSQVRREHPEQPDAAPARLSGSPRRVGPGRFAVQALALGERLVRGLRSHHRPKAPAALG